MLRNYRLTGCGSHDVFVQRAKGAAALIFAIPSSRAARALRALLRYRASNSASGFIVNRPKLNSTAANESRHAIAELFQHDGER